jgi:thiol-disulfide isomerase/thioredoxin
MRSIISAAVLSVLVAFAAAPAVAAVEAGDRATELVSVKSRSGGKPLKLKAFRGKVVVLTFGASWCKPCKRELPAYDKLAKKYRDARANVAFLAINIDRDAANADKFLREAGGVRNMHVGFDPQGQTVDKYEPGTMPTTYIIDARGIVREVHAGFEKGDEAKIAASVDRLLGLAK